MTKPHLGHILGNDPYGEPVEQSVQCPSVDKVVIHGQLLVPIPPSSGDSFTVRGSQAVQVPAASTEKIRTAIEEGG